MGPVAAIEEIEELNIGHSVVSRALFTGLERAVQDMSAAVRRARSPIITAVSRGMFHRY